MENTKQALSARIEEVKKMVEAIESELKSVNEPKDGEWYECTNSDSKFIIKVKHFHVSEKRAKYYILITSEGIMYTEDTCAFIKRYRKITPEEALPYFEKLAEKAGFKKGSKFKCALDGKERDFEEVGIETEENKFNFYGGHVGLMFDNDTNTFATLVEEKVEPLYLDAFKVTGDKASILIEIENADGTYTNTFTHSEIEQIYKLSLKAQGK
jgi:hypothetical protein